MRPAARAGLPDGAIGWMKTVTLEGTQELMKQREVVGDSRHRRHGTGARRLQRRQARVRRRAGQCAVLHRASADVRKAASDILTGKTFDNGVLCSSPNSVVVDEAVEAEARRQFIDQGGYFLSAGGGGCARQGAGDAAAAAESRRWSASRRRSSPQKIGIAVPAGTRALIAELKGVGRDYPLSIEKLCPVLSYYVVKDWREGCERCKEILRYGGMGHTMSIHSQNDDVILRVRAAQAGVSHLRQHADDARVDRADDRPRSGDDAGVRRLRRQHHVGQHFAEAPAQYQAGRV